MKFFALTIIFFFISGFSVYAGGQADTASPPSGVLSLEAALVDFSSYIAGRIPQSRLTAVAITDVPVKRLGEYITDELTNKLLNYAGLRMVSRQDFERIIDEQNLQTAINFNDDSTARMGQNLGWQTIIFGAVNPMSESYRLSLRAVDVETGELKGAKNFTLNGKDPVLLSLVNPDISVEKLAERETILQPFNGRSNNFELTVSINKSVYYDDDQMFITLFSNEDCYFVVYHVDVYNNMQVIFPNAWDRNTNFLRANVARVIPERSSFIMCAPYGEERILVYASENPFIIPGEQFLSRSISRDLIDAPDALWYIESDDENTNYPYTTELAETDKLFPVETLAENTAPRSVTAEGNRGLRTAPRGATAQVVYTILPR